MNRIALKNLVLGATVAAAIATVPAPVAAGEPVACTYDATDHTVHVVITGYNETHVGRTSAGHITVGGVWCGGVATVTNTDAIWVDGDGDTQNLFLELANGGFRPGRTNESGTSDEIEFSVNLGGGSDIVRIEGTDAVQKVDIGQGPSQFGIVRRVNLNAGETTHIDTDVSIVNVETMLVEGFGGADVIRARGLKGTGPDPLNLYFWVYGGEGNDIIKGGNSFDHLDAGPGTDIVYGYGFGDDFHLNDGTPGDKGYGGAGVDHAIYDAGDSFTQ